MNTRRLGRWATTVGAVAVLAAAQALVQLVGAAPASAAVPGYQIVSVTGAFDSSTQKSVTANCPGTKRLIGTGFQLLGAQGEIVLYHLVPGQTGVLVSAAEDQDGTALNWKITAHAVCANPLPGLTYVNAASTFGPGDLKGATATCPAGKRLVGTGASLSNVIGQVSISNVLVSDSSVTVFAIDDQDGFFGSWAVNASAICATAPSGYERKTVSSGNDSNISKILSANCTAGKKALGQGWAFGADGQAHINYAGIGDTGVTQIVNEDDDGTSLNWSMSNTVICATA